MAYPKNNLIYQWFRHSEPLWTKPEPHRDNQTPHQLETHQILKVAQSRMPPMFLLKHLYGALVDRPEMWSAFTAASRWTYSQHQKHLKFYPFKTRHRKRNWILNYLHIVKPTASNYMRAKLLARLALSTSQ